MPSFERKKLCLVTGGASGLGRATAMALARLGNPVALGDLQRDAGLEVVENIRSNGGQALFCEVDVTDSSGVRSFVQTAVRCFGPLGCAVNSAGIEGEMHTVDAYPEDLWQRVIEINLIGIFICMKHQVPALMDEGGSIVNIGSTASLRGVGLMSPYVAAKHGLVGLTKSAALEYAAHNVRINAVCPGGFRTPMSERINKGNDERLKASIPMQRVAEAEEIADVVVWLCSNEATFVTGSIHVVDGGRMAGAPVPRQFGQTRTTG